MSGKDTPAGASDRGPEEATTEYAAQAEPGDSPETGYVRGEEESDGDVPSAEEQSEDS